MATPYRGPTSQEYHAYLILLLSVLLSVPGAPGLTTTSSPKKVVYVMGLFGMEGSWPGGHAMLPAAQMALDHVNARDDILPDYELRIMWNNTKCDSGVGVDVMYRMLNEAPAKLLIIGAGCSPVSEATARASHLWNLVQISYVSASPSLSDKTRFPKFFRVSSPDQLVNPARIEMMREYNWDRVATISESTDLFSKVIDDVVLRFQQNNITLISSEIFTDDPALQVRNLKRHDARIIVAGFYEDKVVKVFCEAYKVGLYGPKYVWIITGWYNDGWWNKEHASIDCTAEELAKAAEGAIGTGPVYINPKQVKGIANLTSNEWLTLYQERLGGVTPVGADLAAMGYDAAWAAAIALNYTVELLTTRGSNKTLQDFSYQDDELTSAIYESMSKVDFQGIKGYIQFDQNGDNKGSVKIRRIQDGVREIVGYFDPVGPGRIEWLPGNPIRWEGGAPPLDSTTRITRLIFVGMTSYIVLCVLAALGIVLSLFFLVFNIMYRKERLIKMSSPAMNNIIVCGCIVAYLSVFLQETSSQGVLILYKLRTYTLMIGFSMAFGALFAKTWRVYVIFTNTTKRTVVKDHQLVLVVAVLVAVDVVTAVIRELADPVRTQTNVIGETQLDGGDTVIVSQAMVCTSDREIYFKASVFAIKGLLLIFGAFLAWQTRKVTIPALNDSQYIGMCVYNMAVLSLLGVVLAIVLTDQINLAYVFTCSFIIFGTTITQLIIFIPKILKFKSSKGAVEDEETSTGLGTGGTKTGTYIVPSGTEGQVEKLKAELATKTKQLEEAHSLRDSLTAEMEELKKANSS